MHPSSAPRSRYYYPNASGPPPAAHHQRYPPHPHHPAMAAPGTLLSSAEESNIFNYLDAFDWELDEAAGVNMPPFDPSLPSAPAAGPSMQHMDVDPYFRDVQRPGQMGQLHPFSTPLPQHHSPPPLLPPPASQQSQMLQSSMSRTSPMSAAEASAASRAAKPLLTQPQKRLNHIMSEQKRRNAIREGYETLAMLLSPGDVSHKLATLASPQGKAQAAAMASEFGYTGRPGRARGSGKNGKAKKMGKGKSGMLFRAVEFCKFLQHDVDALRAEVDRLEKEFAAQSLAPPQPVS